MKENTISYMMNAGVVGSAMEHGIFEQMLLNRLVIPTDIFLPRVLRKNKKLFAILFDCTWDPSNGLAVVFGNTKVIEVGYQDIIL